jgi:6-phosphogluconolactonase
MNYSGYIGTYTTGMSEGIYTFTLNTAAKKIINITLAARIENPTYLAISNNNHFLYSVAKDGAMGGVAAFQIAEELQPINQQLFDGAPPCHVSINEQNSHLFTANYHKGTMEAFSLIKENGNIVPNPSIVQHVGSGPDERQEKAHTHYASLTPDEKYLVAIDLGIDQVISYEIIDGSLHEIARLSVKPGSGPRHLVFHPYDHVAYLITEFSSEVLVLRYHAENGSFTLIQTNSTLPVDFTENNQASAIHISSDGRFIYAGNRGHNSIAVFKVDQATHQLSLIEYTPTQGNWPRDFVIDPSGKFVIVTNQESSNLVLFERDEHTGKLTLIESDLRVPNPVCVKFLHY